MQVENVTAVVNQVVTGLLVPMQDRPPPPGQLPEFGNAAPAGLAIVLLLAGGALYTVGAVMYALRRPDPWPATFGYHEFFHAATVLAWACHHVAIWLVLLR